MPYFAGVLHFLLIDTAVSTASVSLVTEEKILSEKINPSQKDHAAWLHPAIDLLMKEFGLSLSAIDAIGISAGPGSYTGLRVGMSAAKGLCYMLNLPLITVNTLEMMTMAAIEKKETACTAFCPMIDARRMEVFTAVYSRDLDVLMPPANLILDEKSFEQQLKQGKTCFFGNGSMKLKTVLKDSNALFLDVEATSSHMISIVYKKFKNRDFSDLAYSEPYYGKAFYLPSVKPVI